MCSNLGNSSNGGGGGGGSVGGDVVFIGQTSDHYFDGVNKEDNPNCTSEVIGNGGDRSLHYIPLWADVHSNVRWVFLLHHYGFACIFFFLAFYAFFSILNLRSQLSTRPYMSTINSFLCLLGLSRAAGLFIDPYGLMHKLPVLMGALLYDLGFPCLISSFSLIQIAFLQLTQQAGLLPQHKLCQLSPDSSVFVISQWKYDKPHMLDIGPEKLRKKTCLSIIITVHFVVVLVSAIYTSFNVDLMVKLVTQLIFALWGLILCGSFLYAGKQVLGIIGNPSGHSTEGSSVTSGNDKGLVGMGMGLLAPGQNIAASLTAALAPTLLHATPKIKITDENDRTVSVTSDLSRLNDNDGGNNSTSGLGNRPVTPIPGPSTSKSILNNSSTSGGDNGGDNANNSSSSNYVRPPSPVLPRRKSAGQSRAIVGQGQSLVSTQQQNRRQSLNRRGSGYVDEKDANRKKSLTWSESEVSGSGNKKQQGKAKNLGDNNTAGDLGRRQSRKSMDNNADGSFGGSDKNGGADSLLLTGGGGPDLTLQSILSHIAYVNQTALDYRLNRKLSRKNQVQKVIKFTSITAVLGALLCIGEIIRILSPYGLLASSVGPPHLWPWFAMQTICRTIEFAMGATIANITKQPGTPRQNLRFYY